FSRDLASKEADDVTFAPGKVYSMAFAAWDGANGERNGQKSTSQWVSLQVEGAAPVQPPRAQPTATPNSIEGIFWAVIPMALMTLLILGLAGAVFLISKLPDKK
ncbi:MAG: ethylbenzene dehydrogenase-related protein, partial [Chloroflexota bacterium]